MSKEYHDTNLTSDSCKSCDELAKEVLRLAKKINELNGLNSALQYANSQISEHNKAIIKDLKETREQLRVSILWENFPTWLKNNYYYEDYTGKYYKMRDGKTEPFQNGETYMEIKETYEQKFVNKLDNLTPLKETKQQ